MADPGPEAYVFERASLLSPPPVPSLQNLAKVNILVTTGKD